MKVIVLGAGVMGLSCALLIKQTHPDIDVTVIAKDFSPNTTSDVAAGFWMPHLLGGDEVRNKRWENETFEYLSNLLSSEQGAQSGSIYITGNIISAITKPEPSYKDTVLDYRLMTPKELQYFPGYKYGWQFTTIMTECRLYLPWMTKRFCSLGGKIREEIVTDLLKIAEECDVLVNCSGLAAKYLCADNSMQPIRGQLLKVKAPWLKQFLLDEEEFVGVFPGFNTTIIGGTKEVGSWNTDISMDDRNTMLSKCIKLFPSFSKAVIVEDTVGLRPHRRDGVRLEKEYTYKNGKILKIVHNYGHGGSGITVHWGCALDVCKLVHELLEETS